MVALFFYYCSSLPVLQLMLSPILKRYDQLLWKQCKELIIGYTYIDNLLFFPIVVAIGMILSSIIYHYCYTTYGEVFIYWFEFPRTEELDRDLV